MTIRTATYLLPVLALAVLPGCWEKTDTGADLLDGGVKVLSSVGVNMYGREIIVESLAVTDDAGGTKNKVQIIADGAVIAVESSSAPATPSIRGGDIDYGGHVVSVTATPNRFLVDGAPVDLPVNGLLAVANGKPARIF